MYSIIFAAAIFIAVLINDVIANTTSYVPLHSFLGGIVLTLVTILWYLKYEIVGWALILIPIFALLISYFVLLGIKKVTAAPAPAAAPAPSKSSDSAPMCIENPGGPYTAVVQSTPSTVSLPASVPPPAVSIAPITTTPTNTAMTITPIIGEC